MDEKEAAARKAVQDVLDEAALADRDPREAWPAIEALIAVKLEQLEEQHHYAVIEQSEIDSLP